ncbi:MAG: tryptophan--tRNA ligase [Firmicutes bacterium HGW-Firmicutes-13]|nr:MAG: tryptophan--tRNA ligase [Firmicutes bacterium HGW-Firmicutes-13]
MENKGVILSGMRPTGRLQLGNLLGALDNWVKLQDDYQCYFCVVDWHALTTEYESPVNIRENINEMVIDWLSAGLDPGKSVIFKQSDVKEHAELHLLLSMITPLTWLERCPTYKDQILQLKDKNIATYGFLGYPLLQAADILIYRATAVPVGEDQAPHIELTREIARRFNFLYGTVFPEPKTILNIVKLLPGTDGRKMSKSYGNTINLSASPEEIREKVRSMITDPRRIHKADPGNPEVCTVFAFHKIFNPEGVDEIEELCRKGKIGCVQSKKILAEKMIEYLRPIYEKRQDLLKKPEYIREILDAGKEKAAKKARQTMAEVREAMML